jgi:hypothetical protein
VQLRAVRVVRYKPQRRCLIEYDVQRLADRQVITLIGKARARHLDKRNFELQQRLWKTGFDDASEDAVSIPQPVALIPSLQMWLQRRVPGALSIDLLLADPQSNLPSRLAEAIFKLHSSSIRPARSHAVSDDLRLLHEKLPLVAQRHPHLESRLGRLLEICSKLGRSIDVPPSCPVHRDFYHDQIIVDGRRLYLLDLDLFALGDPALDVGNFVAHLAEYALRKSGNADVLAEQQNAMIERYLQLASENLRARILAYSALTLARLIYISTLFDDRTSHTQSILNLCEHRLAEV